MSTSTGKCNWNKKYSGDYIATEAELRKIVASGNYHIVKNITLTSNWTPISSFTGTIDGHGNTISNMKISSDKREVGFASKCSGTILNLNFSGANVSGTITGSDSLVGIIVGELTSSGIVRNCKSENCTITAKAYDNENTENSSRYAIVGGVVGKSSGTVDNCVVQGTSIYGFAKKHDKGKSNGWDEAGFVYAGGVVGEFYAGTVTNNRVDSLAKLSGSAEYRVNFTGSPATHLRICLGGIVGKRNGTSLVVGSDNKCTPSVDTFQSNFNSYNNITLFNRGVSAYEETKKGSLVGFSG